MLAHIQCRVCGSGDTSHLCETHNEHSKTSLLSHYRCRDCGSVFVGNDITPDELEAAYSTLDMDRYYSEIERENRRKMESAIADLSATCRCASILDLGTGNGLFVQMLKDAGFQHISAHEIQGADLSNIEDVASAIYQDFDYHTIPSASFDIVTMLDVVEHVPNPQRLLSECRRILKPGGTVYFHTPIVTRCDAAMHLFQKAPILGKIGRIWQRGRTSVFHLQNYTRNSLGLLLSRAGFSQVQIRATNELSWPLRRYVRIYLLQKQGLPEVLAPAIAPLFWPLLSTNFFNANKAIVTARKPKT